MTQPEPMGMFLRIHLRPRGGKVELFPLGSLAGEELPGKR